MSKTRQAFSPKQYASWAARRSSPTRSSFRDVRFPNARGSGANGTDRTPSTTAPENRNSAPFERDAACRLRTMFAARRRTALRSSESTEWPTSGVRKGCSHFDGSRGNRALGHSQHSFGRGGGLRVSARRSCITPRLERRDSPLREFERGFHEA